MKIVTLQIIILTILTRFVLGVSKCNVPLIQKFTLSGMKYSVADSMKLCGHVHDKCCSISDEIKISKLWSQRTKPIIDQNIELAIMYMKKITFKFEEIAKQDPRSLSLKYIVQREVPYYEQYCDFEQKDEAISESNDVLRIFQPGLQNSMNRLIDQMYGQSQQGRYLRELYSGSSYGSSASSKYGNLASSKYGSSASSKYGSSASSKYGSSYGSSASSKYGSLASSKYGSSASSKYGSSYGSSASNKYGSSAALNKYGSSAALNKYKNLKGKYAKARLKKNRRRFSRLRKRGRRRWGRKRRTQRRGRRNSKNPNDIIQNMNISAQEVQCQTRKNHFYKDFVIVNSSKGGSCLSLLEKQFKFDNTRFRNYLGKVKSGLNKMSLYKANFYCSLCDAHQQKFFDLTQKKFIFSERFCSNLLLKNEAIIKFLNIVMVEYIDFIFEIVTCFESSGGTKQSTNNNFLQKYKRRIPMIQRCYQSLSNGDDMMKNCWFLCHSYKTMEISKFYDGDFQLYKQAYLALYSFTRKTFGKGRGRQAQEDNKNDSDENVDGMLIEPPGPSLTISNKYILNSETRKEILGTETVAGKLTPVQIQKLYTLFTRYRIKNFDKFINNYQKQFSKLSRSKGKSKFHKAYAKQIKRMYYKKLNEIKKNLRQNPEMDPKVLLLFKRIFKNNYMMGDSIDKVTPEHKPLRNLNIKQQRILEEAQNQVVEQAKILQAKIHKIKMKKSKNKNMQRKLKEVQTKQLDNKNKVAKEQVKNKVIPVEPGSSVYPAKLSLFDVKEFKLDFQEEGINPSQFLSFIDFNQNTDNIISEKLSKNPEINLGVINSYLSLRPKKINNFNHLWNDFIMPASEMNHFSEKYSKQKQIMEKAYTNEDQDLIKKTKSSISKIKNKAQKEIQAQRDQQDLKTMKQKLKDIKLEKMQNDKVELNNHIDQEHFESNFHGIKDLFVRLFGS